LPKKREPAPQAATGNTFFSMKSASIFVCRGDWIRGDSRWEGEERCKNTMDRRANIFGSKNRKRDSLDDS
jgi:hypothetical protein